MTRMLRSAAWFDDPPRAGAGFIVFSGDLFDSAVVRARVILSAFRDRALGNPGVAGRFGVPALGLDGPQACRTTITPVKQKG